MYDSCSWPCSSTLAKQLSVMRRRSSSKRSARDMPDGAEPELAADGGPLGPPALALCPGPAGLPSHWGSCCAAFRPSWRLRWNVTPQLSGAVQTARAAPVLVRLCASGCGRGRGHQTGGGARGTACRGAGAATGGGRHACRGGGGGCGDGAGSQGAVRAVWRAEGESWTRARNELRCCSAAVRRCGRLRARWC